MMAKRKRQHYVPKSYMKAFSRDGKTIAVLNLKDNSVYAPVPYDGQCYADYFYGEDGLIEDYLSKLENEWKGVLDKVRNKTFLTDDDIRKIKEFALFQRQRTFAETEHGKQEQIEVCIEFAKSIAAKEGLPFDSIARETCVQYAKNHAVTPAKMLKHVDEFVQVVSDMEIVVVEYNTRKKLISSDVPIIFINPFCPYQIGMESMGLIILFPVSEYQLVVLYDAKMYPRYKGKTYISLSNENEVHNLNILQLISGEKIIFGRDKDDLLKFRSQDFRCRSENRSGKKIASFGPHGHQLLIFGPRKTVYDCNFSFGKIRADFNKIPEFCREAAPRCWDKDWEYKLRNAGTIIHQTTKLKKYISTDFSGKDCRRGREMLFRNTMKYWRE